ncbi:MAG: fibronectin type III domain-containing protein [Lachnospiraceae bacterium]|nr:fibronectin type III domain-containing protein [Lachnospiraceae bacterium]
MVLSIVPITAFADDDTNRETHTVDFGSGSWIVGEKNVSASKTGTIAALAMDEEITLTGFDADTMEVRLVATDGFNTTLTVDESGKTSLSAKNCEGLPDGTLTFSVVAKSSGGGDDPGPGPEPTPPHSGYEGDTVSADLTITGDIDFYINDSNMINIAEGNNESKSVEYTYDSATNTVDFYICCFINMRYTSFKVNGTDYFSQLPTPDTEEGKAALLDACKGQINEFKITVPYNAGGYTIEATQKALDDTDAGYMVVGNFLWTYTDQNQGDDYLDHGRMELVSMEYGDKTYNPEQLENPGSGFDWGQDDDGGSAVLPAGSIVTVKLIPDYGYQLTSFGINGGDFGTGDEQSTFTFEIKPGNFHLGAHFTPVEDKVSSTADIVSEGNIKLGADEIDTGSVVLSVDKATADVSENGFKDAIERNNETAEYKIDSILDINLNQVIYKGTEDAYWSNEMNTLKSPAEISLKLDGDYTNAVVVHEKHDGSFEVIATTYNPDDGTITFKTDSFSNYAVASVSGKTTEPHTHNYGSEWKSDVTNHWKECSCGGRTEIAAHTASDWITDTAATTTTEGKMHKECTVCKRTLATTVIPIASTAELSADSYTYDGKAKTPSVTVKDSTGKTLVNNTDYIVNYASGCKNVGTYKVTIEFKGNYTGTIVKTFKINPENTKISKIGEKSKGFTVKWKKQATQTTGYQIQYSTSSKFKGAKTATVSKNKTTNKTISKLKAKKKYYVRIRTYRKIGSTKYYSSWSKAKTVTTKQK